MFVKLQINGVKKFKSKKDDKDIFMITMKDDIYVKELGEYKGGFSVFTNEDTYNAIQEGKDVVLGFTSSNNVKMM